MSKEVNDGYYVRRREFLNEDPELPAYIIGVVEDTRRVPDDQPSLWSNGEVILDLGDCNRRVSFYFNMGDQRERANSLRKISIIAEVVNAVRAGIELEVASRNARPGVPPDPAETNGDMPAQEVVNVKPANIEEDSHNQVFASHFITLGL